MRLRTIECLCNMITSQHVQILHSVDFFIIDSF